MTKTIICARSLISCKLTRVTYRLDDDVNPVYRVYSRIRSSFLLSFATFGLFLILLGGTVFQYFGDPATAGVVGASGLIIFLVNVVAYLVYLYLARKF